MFHTQVTAEQRGARVKDWPPLMFLDSSGGKETIQVLSTLETTQGQKDGFFSKILFKCTLPEVASVGDQLKICPWVASRVVLSPKIFNSLMFLDSSGACESIQVLGKSARARSIQHVHHSSARLHSQLTHPGTFGTKVPRFRPRLVLGKCLISRLPPVRVR